jgi:hypothetical protein
MFPGKIKDISEGGYNLKQGWGDFFMTDATSKLSRTLWSTYLIYFSFP